METYDIKIAYSKGKLEESARTFRRLSESCADCEIANELSVMAEVIEHCLDAGEELKEPAPQVRGSIEKKACKKGNPCEKYVCPGSQ